MIYERASGQPSVQNLGNFKLDLNEAHLELRETGGTIDAMGFHNTNAIVYQMMARLQIYGDERTATATQAHSKALLDPW